MLKNGRPPNTFSSMEKQKEGKKRLHDEKNEEQQEHLIKPPKEKQKEKETPASTSTAEKRKAEMIFLDCKNKRLHGEKKEEEQHEYLKPPKDKLHPHIGREYQAVIPELSEE